MPPQPDFMALVTTHRTTVWRWAFRVLKNPQEADDITQEVFLALFAKLSAFRGRAKIETWLYRATMNASLTRLNRMRRCTPQSAVSSKPLDLPDNSRNPEQSFVDRESRERLMACVARLPEQEARVITMRFFEERSYVEIGSELKIPTGTIGTLLRRAKKRLHSLYEGKEEGT